MSRDTRCKATFYESFARDWDAAMNMHDLATRLAVVFDRLLREPLSGLKVIDVGSGLGYFAKAATDRGAEVVAVDVGPNLLAETKKRCPAAVTVVSSALNLSFEAESFDAAICTEVIEHTEAPLRAVAEVFRVLRPGGVLALTVPNRAWKWSVLLANALHLRPYQGLENWQGYFALQRHCRRIGFVVEDWFGFNLLPFQFRLFRTINRVADRTGHVLGPVMVNIAARLRKPGAPVGTPA